MFAAYFDVLGFFGSQSRHNFMHCFFFYFPSLTTFCLVLSFQWHLFKCFCSLALKNLFWLVSLSTPVADWLPLILMTLSSVLHFILIRFVHHISHKHCVLQVFLNFLWQIPEIAISIKSACWFSQENHFQFMSFTITSTKNTNIK